MLPRPHRAVDLRRAQGGEGSSHLRSRGDPEDLLDLGAGEEAGWIDDRRALGEG